MKPAVREAERAVCGFRNELMFTGLPTPEDAWRLAAHLEGWFVVEVGDVPCAYVLPGRPALATIPAAWSEARQERALLEEIGHAVLCPETPTFLVGTELRPDRLLRLWESREEARAREFVLGWLLPADWLLPRLGEDEGSLTAAARVTAGELRERLEMLLK